MGTKVVLENIYFETGKAVLRPESFDALDQVFRFLENNPEMKLEISGHTDNTGSLRINQSYPGTGPRQWWIIWWTGGSRRNAGV